MTAKARSVKESRCKVILKSSNSAFAGFPRDEYTTLPETQDRIFATSLTATWRYRDGPTGRELSRSEGLAVASLRLFESGALAIDPTEPLSVDAFMLKEVDAYSPIRAKGFVPEPIAFDRVTEDHFVAL